MNKKYKQKYCKFKMKNQSINSVQLTQTDINFVIINIIDEFSAS